MGNQDVRHLGILGGGQLGRMLAFAARSLGLEVTVLDPDPDSPARAAANHILAEYDDERALAELSECDVITFEFENVPEKSASQLAKNRAVFPPTDALRVAQDRWIEKSTFQKLGIATPRFLQVDSLEDAQEALSQLGAIVLKTRRFGYDGKGQAVVRSAAELESGYLRLGGAAAIAEELVPFQRELSIVAVRDQEGQIATYPLIENTHKDGILRKSVAPALHVSDEIARQATNAVSQLLEHLGYVGVLCLELFDVGDRLLANEFAPRVHNSGHYSIEGSVTSQFENHIRAIAGLPLGSTAPRAPSVMVNLIARVPNKRALLAVPDCHLHDYEKAPREGRKVGHVTCVGSTPQEAQERAQLVSQLLDSDHF
jgi:5-(carboxyamino)imidazole ribonucleotide synthase